MTERNLPSSDATALVLVVELPDELEALRQRSVPDAVRGLPAHITLLYPFVEPAAMDRAVDDSLSAIIAVHPQLAITLRERSQWPGVLYASVEPDTPLRALYEALQAAFPALPIYGGAYSFEPHVTVVEGLGAHAPDALDDLAWRGLPVTRQVEFVDLIANEGGQWATRRRFPLAPAAGDTAADRS